MSTNRAQFRRLLRSYLIGGGLALATTLTAFGLVMANIIATSTALAVILLYLAAMQAVIQLVFFLHLGQESRRSFRLYGLVFTLLIMVVIVIGSVWIMYNLNYNMHMSPEAMDKYMIERSNEGF